MASNNSPIILQSLWRSTSTYWWTKARNNDDLIAFNEPLHENLFDKTNEKFSEIHKRLGPLLRHPKTAEHPFSEYELKKAGGVKGFKRRFSNESFYLPVSSDDSELYDYIVSLMNVADTKEKRPFFKFTRGFLRAGWMAAQFPDAANIYLNRNPAGILNSYESFEGVDSYYYEALASIVHANRGNALFEEFARYSGIDKNLSAYKKADIKPRKDLVMFFWALGLAHASSYADMVIESDKLSDQKQARSLRQELENTTKTRWDISDYRYKKPPDIDIPLNGQILEIIKNAAKQVGGDWDRANDWQLADSTNKYIDLICS